MTRRGGVPDWAAVAVAGLVFLGRLGGQQYALGAQQYPKTAHTHHVPDFPSASAAHLSVD